MSCLTTVYFQGNTMVVELSSVTDVAGAPITTGSGTATVYDLVGTSLGSGAFTHVGSGTYRAVLAHTIATVVGREVDVEAQLDAGGQRGLWRERVPVQRRPIT